ncbi:hypothetical protein BDV24DRAFT_153099 [Aspergillus arachidicola]|uniref:Uncharacterized protein n=1 Tax=Aspergillus arachidicola TaxID=656916 RepID=A0A5N6Y2I4_9EURO|nr:hypothetical protein BDV24DRAFT_153099 [Aspergillus arachidicola]
MSRNRSNIGQGISFLDDVDYGRRPIRTNIERVEESRRTTDRMVQHNRFIFGGRTGKFARMREGGSKSGEDPSSTQALVDLIFSVTVNASQTPPFH